MPDTEDYLTLEDLGDFTLGKLGDFTLGELSMPIDQFIQTLSNKHRDIPYDVYKRIEKLCQDVSSETNKNISIPINNIESILSILASIFTILITAPEVYEIYAPKVKELFNFILLMAK